MIHKLESIREDINKMIELENYDKDELIKKSRELDMYIIKYIKKKSLNSDEPLEE